MVEELKQKPLSRREVYALMNEFESVEHPVSTNPEQLQDVTELIMNSIKSLDDGEFLAKPDFDLLETMSAFEAMDPKMDVRLQRNAIPHPRKLIKQGVLIVDRPLNEGELLALLDEFFVQVSTWQAETAQLQQTVYSCQYLTRRTFYATHNPSLIPYFDAFHCLQYEFYQCARNCMSLRDEDISFAPSLNKLHTLTLKDILSQLNQNIDAATNQGIKGHLTWMRAMLLISYNAFNKAGLKKELANNEEEKARASKKKDKKGKGAKKKTDDTQKAFDPFDIAGLIEQLKQSVELIDKNQSKNEQLRAWATSLFDDSIINALPLTNAKKKYTKKSFEQSIEFNQKIITQYTTLQQILANTIFIEELLYSLKGFVESKPCSLIHLIYEKSLLTSDSTDRNDMIILPLGPKPLPIADFLRKGIIDVHPFVARSFDMSEFSDFLNKYCLVTRELIFKSLRNKSRQRRAIPRYYEDFNILFNEANMYDNNTLSQANVQAREGNTVGLTMVINVVLQNSLELLNLGFELELYSIHELSMVFSYLKYYYMLLVMNRKSMILGMSGDEIVKKGFLTLEDLSQSADQFVQKRKKFSTLQKLICDEFELFKALQRVYQGMSLLMHYFEHKKMFVNVIDKEQVERQVYENRFGVFQSVPFPRFKSYEEFQNERVQAFDMEEKALLDAIKTNFMEGKSILQKLIDTDDSLRCISLLSKGTLEKLQRLIVMNSLCATKASMYGAEQVVISVNLSASTQWLPSIEVNKKTIAPK